MEKYILKLLKSSVQADLLMACCFISELENARVFFKKYGRIAEHQMNDPVHRYLGKRYSLDTKHSIPGNFYFKTKQGLYICLTYGKIVECYDRYNPAIELYNDV